MSTIYVFDQEVSSLTAGTLAAGDKVLIHDVSAALKKVALASDIAAYVSANIGSGTDTVLTASSSISIQIGTTLSARVGFYGKAGTSQLAAAAQAQYTNTVHNPTTATGVVGFSTTAAMQDALGLLMQMRTCLVDNGLMKGAA